MRAVLQVEIAVERVAVLAELAWLERRPELGMLCRAARAGGGHISPAIVDSVLPGLGDAGARNVIAWCELLGLCARGGGELTSLGVEVADSDEAPVPEQGAYDLWLASHPIFGRRVLAAARLSSSPHLQFGELAPLPFEPDRGVIFRSVVDRRARFVLRDLLANHGQLRCIRGSTSARCELAWRLDFDAGKDAWQLLGTIESPQGGKGSIQHDPEPVGIDLWGLMKEWGARPLSRYGRWRAAEHRLAVAFDGLSVEQQDSFLMTLRLERVEVPDLGSFTGVTIEDVPVGPASADDAQRWARARFDRCLARQPAYRSRAAVRQVFAEVVRGTPLEPFQPEVPAHEELVGSDLHARDPALYWSLVAPVDLAPQSVPREELAAVRVGAPLGAGA